MKRTPEEIQMTREHNDVLRARYENYFLVESPPVIGKLKGEMLDECRRVIDATPFGEEMSPEYASIMRAMTGWHYERIRHLYNPKHATDRRYIEVLQDNGEWISHSWNKAINPKSEWYHLQKAMRDAVTSHGMTEYRKTAEPICCHCGSTDDLSVDHKSRSFDEIMQSFVTGYNYKHDAYPEIKDGAMGQGRELADPNVEAQWVAFHDNLADFQILCRSCNARKGRKSLHTV
jgi:5-methylcytosine-specific restriction endonuclease McrA